jgi:hypothetical protein
MIPHEYSLANLIEEARLVREIIANKRVVTQTSPAKEVLEQAQLFARVYNRIGSVLSESNPNPIDYKTGKLLEETKQAIQNVDYGRQRGGQVNHLRWYELV